MCNVWQSDKINKVSTYLDDSVIECQVEGHPNNEGQPESWSIYSSASKSCIRIASEGL